MNNNEQVKYAEDDEIDLRELWGIVYKRKIFIMVLTAVVTLLSIIWVLTKTPIYQVKSNVQIGFIGKNLIVEPTTLVKTANLVFNVEDKLVTKEDFVSEVSSISSNKNLENFIEIKTEAISNDIALAKNKEVVEYIQNKYKSIIEQFILNKNNNIKAVQTQINNLDNLETKNIERQISLLKTQNVVKIDEKIKRLKNQDIKKLQRQILLLKTQDIVKIDEKINRLKNQDIKNLQRQIALLKTQDIVEINEKIRFYENIQLNTLKNKIKFHTDKLNEYTTSIGQLYKNKKNTKNSTVLTISSMQMVNYQNLILNSQNKLEDLKVQVSTIENETIPNLQRNKKNIKDVTIKDLQLKIDNIENVSIVDLQRAKKNIKYVTIKDLQLKIDNIENISIVDLQRSKKNIQDDTLRKLNYKLKVELPNAKVKLEEKINQYNYQNSEQNIQNSKVIGKYVVNDYPVKPKKKLIVVLAFILGFMLSIFLVLFLSFIGKNKEKAPLLIEKNTLIVND